MTAPANWPHVLGRTGDGLVHQVMWDEDRSSYGRFWCGLDFAWSDLPKTSGSVCTKPSDGITWARHDESAHPTCFECIV